MHPCTTDKKAFFFSTLQTKQISSFKSKYKSSYKSAFHSENKLFWILSKKR